MPYLLQAFNLLILLFWVRAWSAPAREFTFNPFLSGTHRLTDAVLAYLRPVLRLPDTPAALLVLLVLAVFKTLLASRLGATWTLTLGSTFSFVPPPPADAWWPRFLYSFFDSALFLLRFATVFLLVGFLSSGRRPTRASEAFAFFARPLSRLPPLVLLVTLLAAHAALALALTRTGLFAQIPLPGAPPSPVIATSPFLSGPLHAQLLKTAWLGALSFCDGIHLLTRALLFLILGNFAAALLRLQAPMLLCHEAVELLLGRFARNRAAAGGGFDFTPLIFFFVAGIAYDGIRAGLYSLITLPFLN